MSEIKVPVKIRPIPIGKGETYTLRVEKGTRLRSLLPEDFDGLISFNFHILNEYQDPEVTEIDDIEFLVPLHGGGGGKDTLRSVAMLTVAAIATVATGGIAHPFLHAAAAISINVAGSLLINELIPPQMPGPQQDEADKIPGFSTKSLSGSRNKPASYSVFPKLYGQRRIKPYYASSPYTEVVGNDQYINLLFFLNFGPVTIENKNGVEEIFGYHYQNGYQDSVLDINSGDYDSQASLASDTIKIDETSMNELDEWQCIIGSAEKIQASTNFRDVEIEYPNINFESGFAYQLEPFSLDVKGDWHGEIRDQKGLHFIEEKILDIPDTTNSDMFEFEISDTAPNGGTLFKIEVMRESSFYYVAVRPKTESIFYTNIKDTAGEETLWQTQSNKTRSSGYLRIPFGDNVKKIRITKYCWVTSTQDISGRTQYQYTPFQSSLQFKSFKFYTEDFAIYTTAPGTYASSIDITAGNGLYYVDSKNKRKKLKIEYDVDYKPVGGGAWKPVKPNRPIGPEADIDSKILKIEGNSAQTYRAGLYWEYPEGVGQYDIRLTPKTKTTYDGYAQESVTWETLKSYQSKGNSIWAPFIDDLPDPTSYPDYINLKKKCTLMYLRLKASPTLQGNTNNISIFCGGSVRDISNIDLDSGTTYEQCDHSVDKNTYASSGNIYADVLLNGSVVENIYEDKINWDALKDFVNFCKTYNLTYNNYEVSEETILQRLNKVCSVGLGKFGLNNEQFGTIRDIPNQPAIQGVTPVNSNSFEASKEFNKKVHGVKVQYTDKSTWETDYVIVYNTGYNLDGSGGNIAASEFLTLEPEGITDIEQAKIYGRYHLATLTLRPEKYTVTMDIENLRLEIGDCAYIAYDTIKVGEVYSRVKEVIRDTSGNVVSIKSPESIKDIQYGKGICFRHDNGSSFDITYPVDTSYTTEFEIFLQTPQQIPDLKVDDIFVYGDINSEKLKAKVTKITPSNDFNAEITFTNAAEEIHETYTTGSIPSYKPIIDSRAEIGFTKPPKPEITSVESGIDFVTTSEALNEPFNLKINFKIPYTLIGVDQVLVGINAAVKIDSIYYPGIYEQGVFEGSKKFNYADAETINYDGSQTYILVNAEPYTDYEIKLFTNKTKGGIKRVSEPDIYQYSTPKDSSIPELKGLEYQKKENGNILLSWTDPNLNFPVIFQVYTYSEDDKDYFLVGATDDLFMDTGKRFYEGTYAVSIVDVTKGFVGSKKTVEVNEPIPDLGKITGRTVDGKIELTWESPSQEISEYEIREGLDWTSSPTVSKISGTSILIDKKESKVYFFMIKGFLPDGNETGTSYISYYFPFGVFGDKPNQKPGLGWNQDLYLSVGVNGDFKDIGDALEYFSSLYSAYNKKKKYKIYLKIENNYTITEPIFIEGFNFETLILYQDIGHKILVDLNNVPESQGSIELGNSVIECKPIFCLYDSISPIIKNLNIEILDSDNNNNTSFVYLNNSRLNIEGGLIVDYKGNGNFCFFCENNSNIEGLSNSNSSYDITNINSLLIYTNNSNINFKKLNAFNVMIDSSQLRYHGFLIAEDNSLVKLNVININYANYLLSAYKSTIDIYTVNLAYAYLDLPAGIKGFVSANVSSCITRLYKNNESSFYIKINGGDTFSSYDNKIVWGSNNSTIKYIILNPVILNSKPVRAIGQNNVHIEGNKDYDTTSVFTFEQDDFSIVNIPDLRQ